jgi:hypothetical protein
VVKCKKVKRAERVEELGSVKMNFEQILIGGRKMGN